MAYYASTSLETLADKYFRHGRDGFVELCRRVGEEIMDRFDDSETFNNWNEYFNCNKWLDQMVQTATSNAVKGIFEVVHKKKAGEDYTMEEEANLLKLNQIQTFSKRFSGNKLRVVPWREQAMKSAMDRNLHGGLVFLPEHAKIIDIQDQRFEGGYAIVRKVHISKMENIPSYIAFAGKVPKAKSELEKRKERSMEALACPVSHPGIIKFWAVHPHTMEAYTLWWNGGSLRSFWRDFDSKISLTTSYESLLTHGHPELRPDQVEWVVRYRKNRAKLAMSLLVIMDTCHSRQILHNDLSPSNVLLHFPEDEPTKVCIGVCDWGLASRVSEEVPSIYGYKTSEELEKNMRGRDHVAPELFFEFGPPNSSTSLENPKKLHPFTKASDAYSVGVLANKIWRDERDDELLPHKEQHIAFQLKLLALREKDVRKRISIHQALAKLTSPPLEITLPLSCYRVRI